MKRAPAQFSTRAKEPLMLTLAATTHFGPGAPGILAHVHL